jgi:pimeloyl-ACP methyl ester carboxylesterase
MLCGALLLTACTASPSVSESTVDIDQGAQTGGRAVVVIEGGGSSHPFTTPWASCEGGRAAYVEGLQTAGLPTFTAPGFTNTQTSVSGQGGCPAQPPTEVQWNTVGYPTQAGQAVLGFLGYLNATYGYTTFDLVGYSYGGIAARATVAALKAPAEGTAQGFSYSRSAIDAGITIQSIATLNSPHLGAPAYDVASDPASTLGPVTRAWGPEYADGAMSLASFEREAGAGAIQVLRTQAHAQPDPQSWDAQQVGVLDGVALALLAGDYCGRECGDDTSLSGSPESLLLRTDGTVPVYSQLLLPCPSDCPAPPGSVYLPPGMVPQDVVRKTFATVHSTFTAEAVGVSPDLSVSRDGAAIAYLVETVLAQWRAAGVSPGGE